MPSLAFNQKKKNRKQETIQSTHASDHIIDNEKLMLP